MHCTVVRLIVILLIEWVGDYFVEYTYSSTYISDVFLIAKSNLLSISLHCTTLHLIEYSVLITITVYSLTPSSYTESLQRMMVVGQLPLLYNFRVMAPWAWQERNLLLIQRQRNSFGFCSSPISPPQGEISLTAVTLCLDIL